MSGLLTGRGRGVAVFLAFAQPPMGSWLDRHGPKRVILCFLSAAVAGCLVVASPPTG